MSLTDEQRQYAERLIAELAKVELPMWFLKPEERIAVIGALAAGTPSIEPAMLERVLTWADDVRRDQGILDNIVKGMVRIHAPKPERGPRAAILFSLSEDGVQSAEELIANMHAKHVAKGGGG